MPLYDFYCEECHFPFAIRATFQQKEAGLRPECPQCRGQQVQQVITAGLRAERKAGVLRMTTLNLIQIVGAPVACTDGVKDTWREIAALASDQLCRRFGEAVRVEYFDLFDPACPPVPPGSQLPLVLINGELFSSGGKISVPAIRKRLEALGLIQV